MLRSKFRPSLCHLAGVSLIILFGFWLRQKSLTSFHFYPDSYYYLWQAEDILHGQRPIGGDATHLGYSFLAAMAGFLTKDLEKAAHLISFLSGLLAIPLIYIAAKNFFKSSKAGLLAGLFLAGSFNHATWSGLVLAETSAIFFLLLSWVLLGKQKWFLAGLTQAISIACRAEYLLLVLPTLAFFLKLHRLTVRTEAFFYFWGLTLPFLMAALPSQDLLFFPPPRMVFTNLGGVLRGVFEKIILYRWAVIVCLGLTFALIKTKKSSIPIHPTIRGEQFALSGVEGPTSEEGWIGQLARITQLGLFGLFIYSIFLIPTLKGWRDFALSDPLLVLLGLAGLILIIRKSPVIGIFFLASTLPLFLAYQRTNPLSHRYLVHLTPILAISAGFLTLRILAITQLAAKKLRPIIFWPAFSLTISLLVFAFLLPVKFVSANWHPEDNYEKLAAYRVQKIIQDRQIEGKTVLITFSEAPYAFYTQRPVVKIGQNIPLSTELALVVIDEAVRDQKPAFAQWAEENLGPFLIEKATINVPYYYADYHYLPEKPVEIYLVPTNEFTIFNSQFPINFQ